MAQFDETYYHNEGEKDFKNGRYKEPNGFLNLATDPDVDRDMKMNEAYRKGYNNAEKQAKL